MSGKMGLLSSMFTDPEYRRRGIAKELLSRVVDEARAERALNKLIDEYDDMVKIYESRRAGGDK